MEKIKKTQAEEEDLRCCDCDHFDPKRCHCEKFDLYDVQPDDDACKDFEDTEC